MWLATRIALQASNLKAWWRRQPVEDRAAVVVFAALALVILAIFRDFGVSWDEPISDRWGERFVSFYASFFTDRAAVDDDDIDARYGRVFDVARTLLSHVSPFDIHDTGHLLAALCGLLGIAGCWRLSRRLFGPRAGLVSALLLALTPGYFGHMFINLKDIPFAAGYIWSVYYLVRCLEAVPAVPAGLAVRFAVAFGLTLAVKVPAAIIGVYVVAGVVAMVWLRPRRPGARPWADMTAGLGRILLA